uniref:Uncharacterized protein n=1 Tax=Salix viminalis TaxID=40686 RepID=A0A6N2KJE0_SALVM
MKFQAARDKCLVNITFDKGVLKIPQLEVDHNFEHWKMISFAASASNIENGTVEHERASNMEEDKASSPNKGIVIDVGNATDIEMAKDILQTLNTEVRWIPLQQNDRKRRSDRCIYRVPNLLRNVNSKAYDPNLISIGPLHRENKRLEAMEKEKLKYFKMLTAGDGMDEKKMCDIVISIKNQEERLRNCYSEKSILMESSDDFVRMILLDAVFIILFFLESNDDYGPKILEPWMTFDIREDLLLLENQLPLFIIQEIYGRVSSHSQDTEAIPFLDLASCHFRKEPFLKRVETRHFTDLLGSRHFTDLLRDLMLGGVRVQSDNMPSEKELSSSVEGKTYFTNLLRKSKLSNIAALVLSTRVLKYSAVKLLKAGVRFEASKDKCLVNITFDKGVLKIPLLEVDHNFERRIRNIMALEQCCYSSEADICGYMKLMDHLIDSAEDVGLLVRKGIIVHRLGDDAAVSNMINHLCEHIGDNYACFGHISRRLNAHYDNRCNHRKATLKLVYFPNVWRGTATVAATILLILTLIQTIGPFKSLLKGLT